MTLIMKQLIINSFNIPKDIVEIIKEYTFHKIKKILERDKRYNLLLTIPLKITEDTNFKTYVYLRINSDKHYLLIYSTSKIVIENLMFVHDYAIVRLEAHVISI